jgi:hypothetical protein
MGGCDLGLGIALTQNRSEVGEMPKRRVTVSKDQLSLFDVGLELPTSERALTSVAELEIVRWSRPASTATLKTIDLDLRSISEPAEPSPFERASYDLYLKSKVDTHTSARTTGALVLILLALVFLDVQISEAGFGFLKIGSIKRDVIIGVVGWLTLLSAAKTLIRAGYMLRKKLDCGLFYQRVLQFSANWFIRSALRFFDILFVVIFLALIVLTLIIARVEMVNVVAFILREFMFLFDPWHPRLVPTSLR